MFVAAVAVAVGEVAVPVRPVAAVLMPLARLPAAEVAASTPDSTSDKKEETAAASVNAVAALAARSLILENTEASSVLVATKADASESRELRS